MKRTITLGLIGAMSLATITRAAEGIWTTKASMPTPRIYLSTSVVDGRIYAIGGSTDTGSSFGTVEEYDPETDTWAARSPMPTTRWGLSTCAVNGKIYAIGGAVSHPTESQLRAVEEYDPTTDTWKVKSPMPTPRWGLSTSVVAGKIYAVGGMVSMAVGSPVVEEYDPATDRWTTKRSMTTGRYAFSACAVNGKVYVLGGVIRYPNNVTAAVEEYDPERDTWTMKGSLLGAKTYFSASELNGRIYAIGGAPHPDNATAIVYEYDPVTGTSTAKPNLLNPRTVLATSAVGGRIYAIGGSTSSAWAPSGLVEEYAMIPTVDFNGDGKVDAEDLGLLADNWGKNTPLCDIGPFAWGDGVVDEKDLGVLMESLVTPRPKASDVPCDVILSWISPSFANTCDVYLGASQETVNTASRANPRGVLVSQGQTATAYDPAEPLELSQTYYWRVDFVIAGPTPTIITGPVLKFTTAALTYQIKNVSATASSAQRGNGPEKTVDGSGLDQSDRHSVNGTDMWWSLGKLPNWIQYEFNRVYTLHEMWVWNFNQVIEPFMGFGAKTVKIEYSTDGTTWTPLANVPEFAKAPGEVGHTANTIVSFAGVPAKFVKLTIEKNWGGIPQTGLSEVRFFAIQSAAAAKP